MNYADEFKKHKKVVSMLYEADHEKAHILMGLEGVEGVSIGRTVPADAVGETLELMDAELLKKYFEKQSAAEAKKAKKDKPKTEAKPKVEATEEPAEDMADGLVL